ncbi:MAG: hypothetical protein ABIJ43_06065 [Candidatus Beckwithbacteria bacterium]|nr:hypothetical protein [Patescibacteria group bacterium]
MDINLYSKKIRKINKKQKLIILLTRSLLAWLIFLGAVMLSITAYSLMVNKKNLKLDGQIKIAKERIENLSDVESKQVYLTGKLKTFEGLIKSQEIHNAVIETVFSLIPDGTAINGFQVETTGEISLSGSVPNYQTLNLLFDRVQDSRAYKLGITKAVVNSISLGKDGSLSFDLTISLDIKV